jgi:PAS domain S-box/diguanylate cyclase (GGDEF) domain
VKTNPKLKTVLILAISCSVLTTSFTVFAFQLKKDIRNFVDQEIEESEQQNSKALSDQFSEKFAVLGSLASFIGSREVQSGPIVTEAMRSFAKNGAFVQTAIADLNGDSTSDSGEKSNVAEYDFFKKSLTGQKAVCGFAFYGKKSLLFSVPVYQKEAVTGVLMGISDTGPLTDALSTAVYGGSGSRLLLGRDGSVILQSDTPFDSKSENLFSCLLNRSQGNRDSIDRIRGIMDRSESGAVEYRTGGSYGYLYFAPVMGTDWYLAASVPGDAVFSRFGRILLLCAIPVAGTALTFLLLGTYFVVLLRRKNADVRKGIQELKALTANIPGCVQHCKYDSSLTIVYCSDGFPQLTGYTTEEIGRCFHNRFLTMIYEPDREVVQRSIDAQLQNGSVIDVQYRLLRKDGSLIWILDKGQLMAESGMEPELYCLLTDITGQREIMQELEISNERYQIVLDQSDSMIFEYDIVNGTVSNSTSGLSVFGGGSAIRNFPESVLESERIHPDDLGLFRSMFTGVKNGAHSAEGEYRLKDQQGSYLWYSMKITTIFNQNGEPVRAIGRISDITCQKEATQKLVQKAQRDGLTGLLNKSATKAYIEQALAGNELCALYIIDVDHFKDINDHLGHMFGDTVLAEIGGKLKKLFRTSDVVGRVGGDEFMVLLKSIGDLSLVAEKADAIHRSLQQTFENGPKQYSISGSIGIAIYPKDGRTYADLYKRADAALYEAKRCGRSRFVVFDSQLETSGHINGAPEQYDSLPPQ